MELYGYRINEQSPSMKQKAYYCKLYSDFHRMAEKINYYGVCYINKGNIRNVLLDAQKDRIRLYAPVFQYILSELHSKGIYHYNEEELLRICDNIDGRFISACLEISEDCCEILGEEKAERKLRELRKQARTRVGAIGTSVTNLAVNMLEAGAINIATGAIHSVANIIGNGLSAINRESAMQNFYESGVPWTLIQKGLREDCCLMVLVISQIFAKELGLEWLYPFTTERLKETKIIIEKIQNNSIARSECPRLLLDCIINRAPYYEPLYDVAEKILGDDNGNLQKIARHFSVSKYIAKVEREEKLNQYREKCQNNKERFFGSKLDDAEAFLDKTDVYDRIFCSVEEQLSDDFNKTLAFLLERTWMKNGKESPILGNNQRRHLVLFNFDLTLMQREKEIQKYCKQCHVNLKQGEIPYYFMDTTSFCTKGNGIVATNYGFYLSNPRNENPLFYKNITSMPCGMMDSMDIYYNGKNAKVSLVSDEVLNNFLIFTCMYFKYGIF